MKNEKRANGRKAGKKPGKFRKSHDDDHLWEEAFPARTRRKFSRRDHRKPTLKDVFPE